MKRADWIGALIVVAVIVGAAVFALTYRDAFIADTDTHATTDTLPATRNLPSAMLWHSRTRGCYLSVDLEEHQTGFVYVPSGWCNTLPVNMQEGK